MDRFNMWRENLREIYDSEAMERFDLREGLDISDVEMDEENVEFLINTEEIFV